MTFTTTNGTSRKASVTFGVKQVPLTRHNKKNDVRLMRDHMRDEAEMTAAQLRGVKSRIFDLVKQIHKRYKKAIKKAARKIVDEGRADQYFDKKT